jgi:hypothetical protein
MTFNSQEIIQDVRAEFEHLLDLFSCFLHSLGLWNMFYPFVAGNSPPHIV